MSLDANGASWKVIRFPQEKRVRECMIAKMFVRTANERIGLESTGALYTPFRNLKQNREDDLDFTIATAGGIKRMDVAEFAPLREHGPRFENAPRMLNPGVKSDLALRLIRDKSRHQGGDNRLLLLYHTEYGFLLDPVTIELMRRALSTEHPRFERVYYLSPFDAMRGTVSEIFPGRAHHICGDWTEEALRRDPLSMPHPGEMLAVREWELLGTMRVRHYGDCVVRVRLWIQLGLLPE